MMKDENKNRNTLRLNSDKNVQSKSVQPEIRFTSECAYRDGVIADIKQIEEDIKDLEEQLAAKKPLLSKKRRALQDVVEPELRKLAADFGFIVMAKGRSKGKIRKIPFDSPVTYPPITVDDLTPEDLKRIEEEEEYD